jgi:hypothetical protein
VAKTAAPGATAVYGRLAAAFVALVAGTAAVIVVVSMLHGLAPITPTATTASTASAATPTTTPKPVATTAGFPAPPSGATVLAAQAGQDGVGLAVSPAGDGVSLQASVVGYPKGVSGGISGLSVRFQVASAGGTSVTTADAVACGAGCYRSSAAVAHPAKVTVILAGHSPSKVAFTLPAIWPPPNAEAKVERAATVWRGLRTLIFDDKLSSGGSVTLDTRWRIVAPDRVAYEIKGSGSSVIIGDRRWDKPSGGTTWQETQQAPVQQPQPFWVSATDARLLGTVSVHGRPAWKISFFDPGTPGWFTILVDKATMHTVDIRMTAIAHFMHDTYGPFNAPISIKAPK